MCTSRLLTIFQHALRRGGVCPPGGCLPSGCLCGGVCLGVSAQGVSAQGGYLFLVPGGYILACKGADPSPPGQRDTCENITFSNFSEAMHKICQFCIVDYSRNTRLNGYSTHSLQQQYLLPHSHIFCILHL